MHKRRERKKEKRVKKRHGKGVRSDTAEEAELKREKWRQVLIQ